MVTVEQKQEGRSRTRTAVSGSPGVLTLTETLWPKSGPRQTLVALTFTPGQAVMSKSIYRFPVSGLLLSKIDCREGTFCRKKESWANRGHVSILEIFISFKQMLRFLNLSQIDFAKRQWHQCFWHHFFIICSEKYIKNTHPGLSLMLLDQKVAYRCGRVGSTHCCEEGWKRASWSCWPLTW